MEFLVWFSMLIGIPAGIWGLFLALQASLPSRTNCRIAKWLENEEARKFADKWSERWPDTFVNIYDHIFGNRKLALRFVFVSALFSISIFAILLIVWYLSTPQNIAGKFSDRPFTVTYFLLGMFAFTNIIPDYISNCQTRIIISRLATTPSRIHHYLGWIFLDFSLTILIAILIVGSLSFFVDVFILVGPFYSWSDAMSIVGFNITQIFSLTALESIYSPETGVTYTKPPYGALLYTTFATSFWMWLYSLSGAVVASNQKTIGLLSRIVKWFDIKRSPLGAIGGVCAMMVGLIYLTVSAFILFV